MPPLQIPPSVAVVGPTATGKSKFAVRVALEFNGEVISCDSMQVYRGLDIGTDKIPPALRMGVPHHLLDVAPAGSYFSAGEFRRMALEALDAIALRGRLAVVVGGTGLYFRALASGLVEAPARDEGLRKRLFGLVEKKGPERVHRILSRLDPSYAAAITPRDSLRIVRAIEVRLSSGKPLGEWIKGSPFGVSPLGGMLRVGLAAPRELLYERIERRVEEMLSSGWLDEVRSLSCSGCLRGPVSKAIGYGELASVLDGRMELGEAAEVIKRRSRNLAKRQVTWFKKEADVVWYNTAKEAWDDDAIRSIKRWLQKGSGQQRDQHPEHDPELCQEGEGTDHDLPG